MSTNAMVEWNARMLDAVEALADRCKWHVFPLHGIRADGCCTCGKPSCESPGKHPADGLKWKSAATTDALTVVRWFGGESIRNVGIYLRASGLAVVELDGTAATKLFGSRFGEVEKSPLVARSGRVEDGWHLYYSAVGLDVPKVARDGIELRVGDHYMVAPPSRHVSGREYAWHRGDPVEEAGSLPPVPELIREWAAENAAPISTEVSPLVAVDRVPEGSRHDYLFRWACSFRDKGASGESLLDHLRIENRKCDPPMPDDEVEGIARDVTKRYTPKHAITPSEWDEPLPLDSGLGAAEPFPVDALPAWLGAYCEAWAETSQTPVDAIAVLTLGAFATAIQGRVVVRLTRDWTEQTSLFVMLVMPSGAKKSATFRAAFAPILKAESDLRITLEPQREDAEHHIEVAKGRAASALKVAQNAKGKERTPAEQASRDAADDLKAAEKAKAAATPPLFYADDVTPEAFVDLLAIHKRMTIASAEGGWFGTFAGRYSEGRVNLDALLKGFSGDAIRVQRKNRDMVDIPNAVCSIVVAVQPAVLREMIGTPGANDRGLLARCVKSAPATRRGYRNVTDPKPMPVAVREDYAARLSVVLHEIRENDPVEVQLDEEALVMFTALRVRHEQESQEGGRVYGIGLWAEKYVGHVARIAGILHFAEHTTDAAALKISAVTLGAAIRIGEYFVAQEIRLDAHARQPQDAATPRLVLDWITEEPRDAFTTRDVFQAKRGTTGLDTTEKVRRVLHLLAEYGYIKPVESTTSGSGRRSETWLVNPAAYPQYPQNPSRGGFEDIEDASGEIGKAA